MGDKNMRSIWNGAALRGSADRAGFWSLLFLATCAPLWAFQERPHVYALEGVRIVVAPGEVIESGNVIIRDGLIEAVGADAAIPTDAEVLKPSNEDTQWSVYPAFIDAAAEMGLRKQNSDETAATDSILAPDLAALKPHFRVADHLDPASKDFEKHRKLGFGIAHILPKDGVVRGSSSVVLLSQSAPVSKRLLTPDLAQALAFTPFGSGYPNSRMGAIAATRQYFYDVQHRQTWRERYAQQPTGMERPPVVAGDDAGQAVLAGEMPLFFQTRNLMSYGRLQSFRDEFKLNNLYTISHGDEWRNLDVVRSTGAKLCLSYRIPDKPAVDEDEVAKTVSLADMQAYLATKRMPAQLAAQNIPFAFTTAGLVTTDGMLGHIQQAIESGLSEEQALAALTTTPAKWLGIDAIAGTVSAGKLANLLVVEDALFTAKPKLKLMIVDGIAEKLSKAPAAKKGSKKGLVGTWSVTFSGMGPEQTISFVFTGSPGNYGGYWEQGDQRMAFESVTLDGTDLSIVTPTPAGTVTITGTVEGGVFEGATTIETPDGPIALNFVGYGPNQR